MPNRFVSTIVKHPCTVQIFGDYKIKQKLNIDNYYTSFDVKRAFFTVFVLTLQTVLRLADVFGFLKMTLVLNTFAHPWFILCIKKHKSKKAFLPIRRIFLKPMLLKVCNCAVPPDHLRKISSRAISNIPKHWKSTKTRRSYLH